MYAPSTQTLVSSDEQPPRFTLKWRRKHLLVRLAKESDVSYFTTLVHQERLTDCLKRSSVQTIHVPINLDETTLKLWANACQKARKAIFLRIPNTQALPKKTAGVSWVLKLLCDRTIAGIGLILLSPIFLALVILIKLLSPGPIFFSQWRVGERGKLFKIVKFRTMVVGAEQIHHTLMSNQTGLHKLKDDPRITPLGHWMRKYSLDELPQIINVLRGEMSLVGPRPWALYDAIRIQADAQHRLNALPGITGFWQALSRSNLKDINEVTQLDLRYLRDWSLWSDLKILLLTVPKVLTGSGAY
jgi:lipopolysaccharide/colanic/teichoic acid biosynthesis glycosyltransferase